VTRLIRSIDDLDDSTVDAVLDRADAHLHGASRRLPSGSAVLGLLFLQASLRTRVGFAAAAARLGMQSLTVEAARSGPLSMPESWAHTLRTLSGYSDLVVARIPEPLAVSALPGGLIAPVLSGGDGGTEAEHPSQALIDLFAMSRHLSDLGRMRLAIVGDLRMRAVRSLLRLLARRLPGRVSLVTDEHLMDGFRLPEELAAITDSRRLADLEDVDVIYVAGIPHGALDEDGRTALRVTTDVMARLPPNAVVLSPLPVIDEVEAAVFADARMRAFQQSDLGLYVRMALLEHLLADAAGTWPNHGQRP
jgi:aspartate carbamoyltransferase catalytic subunit